MYNSWKPVNDCFEHDPLVKLLYAALLKHRCDFDPKKHVKAKFSLSAYFMKWGGFYDLKKNVIHIYSNVVDKEYVCRHLQHEMIHVFDRCRTKFDVDNVDHIACSEIRAYNLTDCREYLPKLADTHQECVQKGAVISLKLVSKDEGARKKVVRKVFDRCYNDLEPFGRRVRSHTSDAALTLWDNYYYSYTDSIRGDFDKQQNSK